jgi:colicin V production protein
MEALQRLQPLDVLFAILWACIVGWGLQSGLVRQVGMLIGVYAAAILSGSLYRDGGQALSLAFGEGLRPQLEVAAYIGMFFIVFGLVAIIIWRAYPLSRLGRTFGGDNVLGGVIAAVWGVLLLIALLTMLRFYAATPWRGQETSQLGVRGQVQTSQAAPMLELVASPLWQAMTPWFPQPVPSRL